MSEFETIVLTSNNNSSETIQQILSEGVKKQFLRQVFSQTPEPTHQIDSTDAELFEIDLREIEKIQKQFDLFVKSNSDEVLSYNPVLDVWKAKSISNEQKVEFEKYLQQQLITNLRERYNVVQSVVNYEIDEFGQAYNELFPEEPFDVVLQRGIVYREQSSREQIREKSELLGWKESIRKLLDDNTPQRSKVIVISGPGVVSKSAYEHNFIDMYERSEDCHIKMTRRVSKIKYTNLPNIFSEWDETYFDDWEGPIDAWCLGKPIFIDSQKDNRTSDQIFIEEFGIPNNTMSEVDFNKIENVCLPIIKNYIVVIQNRNATPVDVYHAFNAILKRGDIEKKKMGGEKCSQEEEQYLSNLYKFTNLQQEIFWLGNQKIDKLRSGCGLSAGFETETVLGHLANLPKMYVEEKKILICECPAGEGCGIIPAEIYNGKIHCPKCESEAPYNC